MASITVIGKYVKVINPDGSIGVNNYFEKARIETLQTIQQEDIITNISTTGLPDLPKSGTVKKDTLYVYSGTVVHCLQTHERTIYEPSLTPALFATLRTNSDTLLWIENEKVSIGWKRTYKDILYECIQSHITLKDWTPDKTPTLWKLALTEEIPVWVQPTGAQDAYQKGHKVHFPKITDPVYESLIDANIWSPIVYPQGWKKL